MEDGDYGARSVGHLWRKTSHDGAVAWPTSASAMPGFGFFKRRTQYNASNSLQPSSDPLGSSTLGATWAVAQQSRKKGAGILFFAYGAEVTLQHFLREAAMAAASFRAVDASINIAVVTNNATVDKKLFDLHIVPRPDLLFAGDPCPYGPVGCNPSGKRPRQWATRLYYLAHSPYEVTWALDSNVVCCNPRSAAAFLQRALASKMWGFDIATANQHQTEMYPHNWNILYRWSRATSNMMRDWLLLQFRRGLATDDQGTLFAAEQRQRAAGGLRVGQVPTPFAAAFYSPKRPAFFPRITRPLTAQAVVLHVGSGNADAGRAWCAGFNKHVGTRRQLWLPGEGPLLTLDSLRACKKELKVSKCPYVGGSKNMPEDSVYQPELTPPKRLKIAWGEKQRLGEL